ncbi:MAG: hypothetical protein DCF25_09655 [Leptolyngbya foveolarum]|uniref:Peptidase M15A C-terminal domain-containing protein n=1 Tax=Leptolyngbya foveolarum TaxID=47253 RepID=A0A2W4UE65_9CYAN|nr:MAG: hypothetical protein DCF25_09655 [Leptolyngbya foveolarum]
MDGDRAIHITSGYRDSYSNRSVGGARDSRHIYGGGAVDFWVEGLELVDVFYQLKKYHPKGGLAVGSGFRMISTYAPALRLDGFMQAGHKFLCGKDR